MYERKSKQKKHMSCVFGKKSKRENTNRKLVGACREEKCVFGMKGKRKNTCRVFLRRKVSGETQTGSLSLGCGGKLGVERNWRAEKPTAWARRAHMCEAHI